MNGDVLEALVDLLIDEETLGVGFEIHRAIKLQYYDVVNPDPSSIERHDIVDEPGRDVFGNNLQSLRKPVECVCPSCQRTLGASKFAPHLEKCLGMGRTSSRLAAHKRPHSHTTRVESEGEHSDDNEDEWTYPEKKGNALGGGPKVSKKMKKEKFVASNVPLSRKPSIKPSKESLPLNGANNSSSTDGFYSLKPSLQQHNAASFSTLPTEYKHQLLHQICGVISERTGKLCTRTMKCPQHSEEDRREVRRKLLDNRSPVDVTATHRSSSSYRSSTRDQSSSMEYDTPRDYTPETEDNSPEPLPPPTSSYRTHKQRSSNYDNSSTSSTGKKHRKSHHHHGY